MFSSLVLVMAFAACPTLATPVVERQFVSLLGNATFPEYILNVPSLDNEKKQQLLVGGFGDGSLQLVDIDHGRQPKVEYYNAPGANGMIITVGFVYDESRDYLWVANFDFQRGSQLKVFKYTSKKLLTTIPSFDTFVTGSFFNELTMASDGTVYISDTFNPIIWMASPRDLTMVTKFVTDPLLRNPVQAFGLNGLAISPNEKYLVASVMDRLDAGDGRLVRISLTGNKQVSNVLLTNKFSASMAVEKFAGSDGMFFLTKDLLVMVNIFPAVGAIFSADFMEADFSMAKLEIRDTNTTRRNFGGVFNRPTASAVLDDNLWTVNSQLDHIIDDANGALGTPVDLPFQIVGVPLASLGLAGSGRKKGDKKGNDDCGKRGSKVIDNDD